MFLYCSGHVWGSKSVVAMALHLTGDGSIINHDLYVTTPCLRCINCRECNIIHWITNIIEAKPTWLLLINFINSDSGSAVQSIVRLIEGISVSFFFIFHKKSKVLVHFKRFSDFFGRNGSVVVFFLHIKNLKIHVKCHLFWTTGPVCLKKKYTVKITPDLLQNIQQNSIL